MTTRRRIGIGSRALAAAAVIVLVIAACTPTTGRPAVEFLGTAETVISEIAGYGITLQPGSQMNFYSIDAIGDRFVTLRSESTTGFTIFFGRASTTLNFTAQQRGQVTVLAASGQGVNAEEDLDAIIAHLSQQFDRP